MKTKIDKDNAKTVVGKTATKTFRFTVTIVKIIFILIIVYTVLVTMWVFLYTSNKGDILTNIATISAGGFWAFFLGYFGWRMGQTIELYFIELKKKRK